MTLHSIPSLSLHPCFSILLLVLTLTKNEEQILALERGTNSFSWTINGERLFPAFSGSYGTGQCLFSHDLLPDAQAGTKDQVRRSALNRVNLVMMTDSETKE